VAATLEAPEPWVTSVAFMADSRMLATTGSAGQTLLWEVAKGQRHGTRKLPQVVHVFLEGTMPSFASLPCVAEQAAYPLRQISARTCRSGQDVLGACGCRA